MDIKRFYEAPDTYTYHERLTEDGVTIYAGTENWPMMGIDRARSVNIPLLPDAFKEAIAQVRLERAKTRAAQKADAFKESWNKTWRLARS